MIPPLEDELKEADAARNKLVDAIKTRGALEDKIIEFCHKQGVEPKSRMMWDRTEIMFNHIVFSVSINKLQIFIYSKIEQHPEINVTTALSLEFPADYINSESIDFLMATVKDFLTE